MKTKFSTKQVVGLAFVMAVSLGASLQTYAADQPVTGPLVPAQASALGQVASGAVEDTLKACLARIPAVATVGQRMLAERSCAGEEGARALSPGAPKF